MNLKARFWLSSVALVSVLLLAACGGNGGTASGGSGSTALNVTSPGEQLAFSPSTLEASANQQATVTYTNGSAGQNHTWVLVKGGDEVAAKVNDAAAGSGGEVAVGGDVLAATKVVKGGASETVTFTVPAGTYTFLCSVPGHYLAGMKGALTVK
jgi:plastocyanin